MLRLDPASGEIERRARVGGSPSEVVAAGNAVWVAVSNDEKSGRVVRIDPRTAGVVAEKETTGAVEGVAVDGATGDVWTVVSNPAPGPEDRADSRLLRVDPSSNEISQRLRVPGGVSDAVAGGGAVWITNPDGDLLKIDPSEKRIAGVTPLESPGPYGMEYGAGAVWVAGVNVLTRVDPGTGRVAGSLDVGPYGAEDVTVGEDHIWTVGPGAGRSGVLTRVTP